jgi:hypothetical protein
MMAMVGKEAMRAVVRAWTAVGIALLGAVRPTPRC